MGVRTLHLQEEDNEPEEKEYNKKEEQEWIKNKEDWV